MFDNIIENWNLAKNKSVREKDKNVFLLFLKFSWIDIKRFFVNLFSFIISNYKLIYRIIVIICLLFFVYNLYQIKQSISSANRKLKIIADSVSTNRVIEPDLGDRVE